MESSQTELALTIAQSDFAIRIASAIAFAILYFDYSLTFGAEVERFWKRSFSPASFGYFLNRCLSLFGHIPVIYEFYGTRDESVCQKIQMYHQMLSGVTQAIVAILQLLRIRALYKGSRRVFYSLLGLCVVVCIISGWAISRVWNAPGRNDLHPVQVGCDLTMSAQEGKYLGIVWSAILSFDIAVFVLILYKALRAGREWRGGLFELLLWDGAIYFGVLLICQMTNILTCLLAQTVYRGISVTITNVIATSLIARLMLNIRDPDWNGAHWQWQTEASGPVSTSVSWNHGTAMSELSSDT